jgi:hypothetical protein
MYVADRTNILPNCLKATVNNSKVAEETEKNLRVRSPEDVGDHRTSWKTVKSFRATDG